MIARVKWCKPVSSHTRLRPNVKHLNSRKGGKLATVRTLLAERGTLGIRNHYRRRTYPLDKGGEQERVPVRIMFGSETSRNTSVFKICALRNN